jgi:hypothetical protein
MNMLVEQKVVIDEKTILEQNNVAVEAYDVIEVAIAPSAADVEVNIQPGPTGAAKVVMIKTSSYPSGLLYKVHASTNPAINLENAHLYLGAGQIGSMGAVPDKLFFSNGATASQITIIVGRDSTP